MQAECGTELFRFLQKVNQLDLELWRSTSAELDRRINFVPGFQARLVEYQNRIRTRLASEAMLPQAEAQQPNGSGALLRSA